MEKYNIEVLMSTYNGEKFLREQINSILKQKDANLKILIRDDGSNDSTKKILEELQKENSNIEWYGGNNLKPAKSFMDLLKKSNSNFSFFAFADQDDYWQEDKLSIAINALKKYNENQPVLYFSNKEVVDENLRKIKYKEKKFNVSIESAMIDNPATGCTMVMNKKLRDIINEYTPDYIEMHDSWIYRLCLSIGGIIIYDNNKTIKYRQHGNNTIGARESIKQQILRRINSFKNCKHAREKTAQELLKGYSKYLDKNNEKILNSFANYRNSIKSKLFLVLYYKNRTSNIKDNLIFKCAVLINRV